MLKLLRIFYRPACQTLSNAFLKSMKLWNRLLLCCGCFSLNDSTMDNLFYCAPAWSKACLFFCQQFLSLWSPSINRTFLHEPYSQTFPQWYLSVLVHVKVSSTFRTTWKHTCGHLVRIKTITIEGPQLEKTDTDTVIHQACTEFSHWHSGQNLNWVCARIFWKSSSVYIASCLVLSFFSFFFLPHLLCACSQQCLQPLFSW